MNNEQPTDFFQLAKILKESPFVISNDTGPAHLAAHLVAKDYLYSVYILLKKLVL